MARDKNLDECTGAVLVLGGLCTGFSAIALWCDLWDRGAIGDLPWEGYAIMSSLTIFPLAVFLWGVWLLGREE